MRILNKSLQRKLHKPNRQLQWKELAKLGAKVTHVLGDGDEVDIPIENLRVDDVVRVRSDEKVRSDGILLEAHL